MGVLKSDALGLEQKKKKDFRDGFFVYFLSQVWQFLHFWSQASLLGGDNDEWSGCVM